MSLPFVTDHALLRHLERACGINVELIREHIALLCAPAASVGAKNLKVNDVTYVFQRGNVVTVLGKGMKRNPVSDDPEGGSQTEGRIGAVHTKGPDHSAVPVRKARGMIGGEA